MLKISKERSLAMTHSRLRTGGFTLVELMIAAAIIAVLTAVFIPKYADTLQRAQEGSLKGNLGSLRSAITIYSGDNSGAYPSCVVGPNSTALNNALVPKYIDQIPSVRNGLHAPTNAVYCDAMMVPGSIHDSQGWYYDGALPADSAYGVVSVACDHTDTKGTAWTSY